MSRLSIILFMVAIMAVSGIQIAHAASLTVLNAGFEDSYLPNDGDYTWGEDILGWSFGYYDGNEWTSDWAAAGASNPNEIDGFTGGAAEGNNTMFVIHMTSPLSPPLLAGASQALVDTLKANTEYVLSVQVGNALYNYNYWVGNSTADYRLELLAGNVLLEFDTGESPVSDTWEPHSLTYNSGSNPAQKGQPLAVRLIALGEIVFPDYQLDFDDVTLTATTTAVPVPATVLLLGAGLVGIVGFRRKNNKHNV
jgi:hypothetical protein